MKKWNTPTCIFFGKSWKFFFGGRFSLYPPNSFLNFLQWNGACFFSREPTVFKKLQIYIQA